MRVSVISLGCAKNLVDTEVLLGGLVGSGVEITPDVDSADVVIVNTCGFIEDAKRESVETILDLVEEGKRVLVMGCLVERYREELIKEIPEVEAYFGTQSWDEVLKHLGLEPKYYPFRVLTTPGSYAYVKISEGCNRLCSFCAIPRIRGRHRSRPVEEIVDEVKRLADLGVKEINIVSQDTTYYGRDLYGRCGLVDLLREIEKVDGIEWIRLLYLYPTEVGDDLLDFIAGSEKVLPYLDIPIQHISTGVLRSMRRGYDEGFVRNMVERIREKVPGAVLRTTLIVGYPTETEGDFKRLLNFLEEGHFFWAGVFTYSREEGTHAYDLGDPVPAEVKEERKETLLSVQRKITSRKNRDLIGKRLRVLIDGFSEEFTTVPKGRAYIHAPEVDGSVYLDNESGDIRPGDLVEVEITQASEYDLGGRVV
ncbi:MAG: 30S ribosomal protein S12 methylthiotransferase RimO [Aquificota bacterium]|nr:30S ribosomal protein S12 methylthiotransferase RimO [Aquificota bacterium]